MQDTIKELISYKMFKELRKGKNNEVEKSIADNWAKMNILQRKITKLSVGTPILPLNSDSSFWAAH